MHKGRNRAQGELPFEPQPDVNQNRPNRENNSNRRRLNQFTRHSWTDGIDRNKLDVGNRDRHCFFDVLNRICGNRFLAFLRLNADRGDVLVGPKCGITDFDDRHITQFKRRKCGPIQSNIDGLCTLGPNRRSTPEIDTEIQALDHEAGKSNHNH